MTPPPRRRNLKGILAALAAALAAAAAAANNARLERIADAAHFDTFPTFTVRDTTGAVVPEMRLEKGDSVTLCLLARNRYTGRVQIFADKNATDADVEAVAQACEKAAGAVEAERDQ